MGNNKRKNGFPDNFDEKKIYKETYKSTNSEDINKKITGKEIVKEIAIDKKNGQENRYGLSSIRVIGAKEHNLKNISVTIPRNSFSVITGVSGSGKSSLAFDTLYAEGQRRYVESLSSYARQFLGLMKKPEVEFIEGLSPAISIEQKKLNRNPRSTVGTITEIYDYLRLLYANVGQVYCYKCGRKLEKQSIDQMIESIYNLEEHSRLIIMAPYATNKKGTFKNDFENLKKIGFFRVNVDGKDYTLDEQIELNKNEKHSILVVVDRVELTESHRKRIFDALEQALKYGNDKVLIHYELPSDISANGNRSETSKKNNNEKLKELFFSAKMACPYCEISYPDINPALFSFNLPIGACPSCHGLGVSLEFDVNKIIDLNLSIMEGGILPISYEEGNWSSSMISAVCSAYDIPLNKPLGEVEESKRNILLYGTDKEVEMTHNSEKSHFTLKRAYEGVIPMLSRRYGETNSDEIRLWIEQFMKESVCNECNGQRLNSFALSVKIKDKNIMELSNLTVSDSLNFIDDLKFSDTETKISRDVMKEIKNRLIFLKNVGLGYITLERKADTLSGGEAQRINLATQIGSQLTGVMYVLDEPTIGLHQKDNEKLLSALRDLQKLGNTLIIVEHDKQTILDSDYIIDLGPGAGLHGGQVMYQGDTEGLLESDTLTGKYLRGEKVIPVRKERRKSGEKYLKLKGATLHNLKNIDVNIPLKTFSVVTGVSGSGKSTCFIDLLFHALYYEHSFKKKNPDLSRFYNEIEGVNFLSGVYHIDQSPIGRTPRSNPATYIKVFDNIRSLFSSLPESKARGYNPGRFSFNVKGGRCEHCQGEGQTTIKMHFLPDVNVTCEVCKGKRFNSQTLEIYYKGKNIADILDLSIDEAYAFFEKIPSIESKLKLLIEVGLGYLKLGQPAPTLSGGEAQRLKLTRELGRSVNKNFGNIYFLDEPTTGLHFDDIAKLLYVLQKLVDNGNTVVVIEHNLDLIKAADYIIDLGPDGGDGGGEVVFQGFYDEFLKCDKSYTQQYLLKELQS